MSVTIFHQSFYEKKPMVKESDPYFEKLEQKLRIFKMEKIYSVLTAVQTICSMATFGLKDPYHALRI